MKSGFLAQLAILLSIAVAAGCSSEKTSGVGTRIDALDASAWDGSVWISAANAPVVQGKINDKTRSADGSSWFVSTLTNEKKVVSAKWMTTGLGVYYIYVNGATVGKEILKPGFTHRAKTKISYTYDITDAIATKKGAANVFSAQVTPGWWADKIVTPSGHEGMIGRKCAFRGVIEFVYEDGTTELYGTNLNDWKAGIAGPVTHASIFDGEEFDARRLPGHDTPEVLEVPEENKEFSGEIVPSSGAEVYLREDLALAPVKAYKWDKVEGETADAYGKVVINKEFAQGEEMVVLPGETLIVDFGQNCAAVPSFEFKAKEGTTLVCLPSELLNDGNGSKARGMDGPEGSCHRLNLRTPDIAMKLSYTFGPSKSYVEYHPLCTFFGYRFISVTADAEVHIKKLRSIPVTSIADNLETGYVETGNDLINRLISNVYWGQLSNYLSVPTDCPQRNERLGWTADTQVFAETGTFFANTASFFHKWMRDMRDSRNHNGAFPGVAPTSQYGGDMMRLGWADAGIIVPWTVWKQFNDIAIINENWEAMEKFIGHINDTKYNHQTNAAENHNYQWADWLSYEPLESCGGGAFTTNASGKRVPKDEALDYWNYLSASYWIIDAGMMRDMALATGRDAAKYEKMLAETTEYTKTTFLKSDGTFKTEILNTMQTPALFALKNGLVEGEAKERMIARLRENFAEHDNCLQTGFLGTSILMKTLTDNGMTDMAYELFFQRKNPSWLYSVDNGATTIWERWNSYTLENGMGPKGMNSFNHYAYGCVAQWIWETVCGISADVAEPGFKHIIMKPVPDKRLGWVRSEYKSAAGTIKSEWKYEGDKWEWNFTVPEGATATVTLPGDTASTEYSAGTYSITR